MGDARLVEVFQEFSRSAADMGGAGTQDAGLQTLYARGYPVLDLRKAPAVPGLDPSMLRFLPEAQRAQIMQQMGGGAGGVSGMRVVGVQADARRPPLGLDGLPRVGFAAFMQRQMGGMR
jgi:hypothetical protein